MHKTYRVSFVCAVAAIAAATCGAAYGQAPRVDTLIASLRDGGYVIVMRHASSPRERPTVDAAPGNDNRERQLDQAGLDSAAAMGKALRALRIPIGEVLVSPTFRALETARQLDVGEALPVVELGDGGQNMRPDAEGRRSAWLRDKAAEQPPPGTNRLMITHFPNLSGAFGAAAAGMGDGESMILRPGAAGAVVVGRIKIGDWAGAVR
jgi:phosphohistidine phosphatase SixA